MNKHTTLRTLALSIVLASSASHAGLFSKKPKPAPAPVPEPIVVTPVAPVEPPPPPAPIPLEFSGIKTALPQPAPMDRLQSASKEVLDTVQWIGATKNNAGLPFVVVDKVNAQVYSFTPFAQLKATAPVLLGAGTGDMVLVSPDAPMSSIPPQKRITPAGRYPSRLVIDNHKKTVLLVDGPNLITMHVVAPGTPAQRRAERLASVTSDDNRVSFGCINVPPAFFATILEPDFKPAKGVVYILPEKQTAGRLFGFQPTAAPINAPGTAPITAPGTAPVTAIAAAQAPGTAPVTAVAAAQAPGTAVQVAPVALQAAPASAVEAAAAGTSAVAQ